MLTLKIEAVNIVDQEYETFSKELDQVITYEYSNNRKTKEYVSIIFDELVEDNDHIYHITVDLFLKVSGQPQRLIASTNTYKSDTFISTHFEKGQSLVEFRIPFSCIPVPLVAHKYNRVIQRNKQIKKMVRGERLRSASDLENHLCKRMILS
jgi:hypothetical protein